MDYIYPALAADEDELGCLITRYMIASSLTACMVCPSSSIACRRAPVQPAAQPVMSCWQ